MAQYSSFNGVPGELLIREVFSRIPCGELFQMKESMTDANLRSIMAEAYRRYCETSPRANIPKPKGPPPAPRKGASQRAGGSKKKRATK